MNLPNFINFDAFNRLRQRMGTNRLGNFRPSLDIDPGMLPADRLEPRPVNLEGPPPSSSARELARKVTDSAQAGEVELGKKVPRGRPGGKAKSTRKRSTSDAIAQAAAKLAAKATAKAGRRNGGDDAD